MKKDTTDKKGKIFEVDWMKRLSEYCDKVGYTIYFSKKDRSVMSDVEVQSFAKLLFTGLCSIEFIQMGIYKKTKKSL